jgi:hypothetical protein
MADDGQSAFAEPMSMQEALDKAGSLMEAKPAEPEETPLEADNQADDQGENPDVEAEEVDEPEPKEESDGPQVLSIDEYGDVLVTFEGEETTLSDLAKGNLRQADYSRKTAALAQERKAAEAELTKRESAIAERERQLESLLSESAEQEPDWVKLAEDDPLGYPAEVEKWKRKQQSREKQQKELMTRQEAAVRDFAAETGRIAIGLFPEWSEGTNYVDGVPRRKAAALSAGFTEAEFMQAHDHRLSVLLEKAARFDEIQAKGEQKSVQGGQDDSQGTKGSKARPKPR